MSLSRSTTEASGMIRRGSEKGSPEVRVTTLISSLMHRIRSSSTSLPLFHSAFSLNKPHHKLEMSPDSVLVEQVAGVEVII